MKMSRQMICSFMFVVFLVTVTGTALASDVNVEQVGHLSGVYITAVEVVGNYAYVADSYQLVIVDVSNPSSPTRMGSHNTAESAQEM